LKTIAAILFLLLILFHLIGYQLCFYYVQKQADLELQATLDNQKYSRKDLFVLRVPLSLPFQTDWKDFEQVNGEINIKGQIYKYVERKIENGELVLLCIPDHNRSRIEAAKVDFFKLANSLQIQWPEKKSEAKVTSIYKAIYTVFENTLYWQGIFLALYSTLISSIFICTLSQMKLSPPSQPPDGSSFI
jgi:hypothetical protein